MLKQYLNITNKCKKVFEDKFRDYNDAWKILRPSSVVDQIFIKGKRIRHIEETGINKVGESCLNECIGIANYAIIGLILGEKPIERTLEQTMKLYNKYSEEALSLISIKNHDYADAWQEIKLSSITDIILMKILRLKSIYNNKENLISSEGPKANYLDIFNYAIFYMIRLSNTKQTKC